MAKSETGVEQRPMRNLIVLSTSFLMNFSAYASLEVVQSSLNSEIGTLSLSATYFSLVVSSLVLPPLIIDRLGYKKSMAISILTYALYTAANFYPRKYTLIPTGILLGAGAAVLWAAQRVYVTNLALHVVGKKSRKSEKKIGYFFGIFYALYSLNGIGNILMSLLLMRPSSGTASVAINITNTTFSNNHTTISTQIFENQTTTQDDMNYGVNEMKCGIPASDHWEMEPRQDKNGNSLGVDITMLYILLSSYLVMSIIAALLLLFAIDEVPEFRWGTAMQSRKAGSTKHAENKNRNDDKKLVKSDDEELADGTENLQKIPQKTKTSLIMATARLMATNRQLQLVIPSTVHYGIVHTLMATHFMKFWVACSLGIGYVGYVALVYSVMSATTAYIVGRLLRWFRRMTLFICSCFLETGCLLTLMLWSPNKEESHHYAFFLWAGCLSVVYTSQRTLNNIAYSSFFVGHQEAAQSALAFWDSLGRAVMFGLAAVIGVKAQVYLLLGLMLVGGFMYFIAERRHLKISKQNDKQDLVFKKAETTPKGAEDTDLETNANKKNNEKV